MLDIRYFNGLDDSPHSNDNQLVGYHNSNNEPVLKVSQTSLESSVSKLLADYNIGGVILFSENLVNKQQIIKLTDDIQEVATFSSSSQKLFISIDQEGGRVARLPRDEFPAFTGNMAIGALKKDDCKLSYEVGEAIGQQLSSLGINVNHAPTIDVNSNPNNPVINVRAFSDCPKRVAELGCGMGQGMLSTGIIPTFKHFPGHGDTNVDSHTGLPLVNHDIATVYNVDLFPFINAIEQDCAPMIMTAHIQYPVLDDSMLVGKNGDSFIRPATLSYDILTTLLRDELQYQGVVITDALDMASISHYLTPTQTVIETFKAGSDIALMPFKIHKPTDIVAFNAFFDDIVREVSKDSELCQKVIESYNRISLLKNRYLDKLAKPAKYNCESMTKLHKVLEQTIAEHSIVIQSEKSLLDLSEITKIVTVFNTKEQGIALSNQLTAQFDSTINVENFAFIDDFNGELDAKEALNTLLVIGIEDVKSLVDIGGVDDLAATENKSTSNIKKQLLSRLFLQKKQGGQSVFICLKAPYNLEQYIEHATIALTSFDGSVYLNSQQEWEGPAFSALAKIITKQIKPCGIMPINN